MFNQAYSRQNQNQGTSNEGQWKPVPPRQQKKPSQTEAKSHLNATKQVTIIGDSTTTPVPADGNTKYREGWKNEKTNRSQMEERNQDAYQLSVIPPLNIFREKESRAKLLGQPFIVIEAVMCKI